MLIKIVFTALILIVFSIGAGLFNVCMEIHNGSVWRRFLDGFITTILILISVSSVVTVVVCIVYIWR